MQRWNKSHPKEKIDYINVIWKDGKLYGPVGKYKGLTVKKARDEVYKDLKKEGLIEKEEEIEQSVSICERCKEIIEPIISSQWYVQVNQLQKNAIKAVKNGDIKIHPKYMSKRYFQWMKNLRDWPISRSLWWGYRIPAWYQGVKKEEVNDDGKVIETVDGKELDVTNPKQMKVQFDSPGKGWNQDEDVLDTWFSSGQWPYATLTKENLMDYFYPTDVMETGYGILELWVSRMIMLGLYRTNKIPFKDVYLHGMLKGTDGRTMSKSKGNVISMDDVVNEHGADTLRQFYYVAGKAGRTYRFDWERIKYARNFLNKLWNASKFVFMNLKKKHIYNIDDGKLEMTKEDKEMLKEVKRVSKKVAKHIRDFRFNLAIEELQDSFWHIFCDSYLEYSKEYLYSDKLNSDATQFILWKCLKTYLELMHPFIPFITEYVWQKLPKSENESKTIMYTNWPE
jgi:valyl-tRNA synthetase